MARVILDICISGEYPFFDLNSSYIHFEFDLSYITNAFITDESRTFFVSMLTRTGITNYKSSICNLRLRSTNFDDYMLGLFCYCIQWRITNNLPITFQILDFAKNELTDCSFELFCEYLPFMFELQYISFEWNLL